MPLVCKAFRDKVFGSKRCQKELMFCPDWKCDQVWFPPSPFGNNFEMEVLNRGLVSESQIVEPLSFDEIPHPDDDEEEDDNTFSGGYQREDTIDMEVDNP